MVDAIRIHTKNNTQALIFVVCFMYRSKYDYIGYQNTIFVLVFVCVCVCCLHLIAGATTVSNSDLNNLINYATIHFITKCDVYTEQEKEDNLEKMSFGRLVFLLFFSCCHCTAFSRRIFLRPFQTYRFETGFLLFLIIENHNRFLFFFFFFLCQCLYFQFLRYFMGNFYFPSFDCIIIFLSLCVFHSRMGRKKYVWLVNRLLVLFCCSLSITHIYTNSIKIIHS